MQFFKKNFLDILFLGFSLITLFLFFNHFKLYLDVSMADETVYMQRLNLKIWQLIGSFAPIYTLTYKFFHCFIKDYINLHHFAIISLSWVPSVGLYLFLRLKKFPFIIAAYLAWALFLSSFIVAFDWWPRVSHYSLFLIFIFFSWLPKYTQRTSKIFLLSACFALFMAFVRPEFFMSSIALFTLAFCTFLHERYKNKITDKLLTVREKIFLVVFLICIALMTLAWHSPLYGGRMYYAMGQHYTFNTIKWNHKRDASDFIYWEQIFKNKFGNSETLSDMYKANPKELQRHITENFYSYITQIFAFTTELFFPKFLFKIHFRIKWLLLIAIFLALLYHTGIKKYKQVFLEKFQQHFIFIVCIMILVGASVVASIIIYPREHYYILQLAFIYYLFYLLFIPFIENHTFTFKYQKLLNILILLSMIFATPNIKSYPRYNSFYHKYDTPVYLPYIYAVRDLKIVKPTTFLVSEILPVYMGKNFRVNIQFLKDRPFDQLMQEQDIGMMYISDVLLKDKRFSEDTTWIKFINNYESLGWVKLQLPDRKEYIIYRKDLLPNNAK